MQSTVRRKPRVVILERVLPSNIVVQPSLGGAPSFVCFHPELIIDAVV